MNKVYFNSISIAIAACIIFNSCLQYDSIPYFDKLGVNSQEWKIDSFGCRSYRYSQVDKFVSKPKALSFSKAECLNYFGSPNLRRVQNGEAEILFYFCQPSLFCDGKASLENVEQLEILTVYFSFSRVGNLVDYGIKVP
jgi:hypothetical protein